MSLAVSQPAQRHDPYIPWRSSLLTTSRVRQLSELRPWPPLIDTLRCWVAIVGAWTAVVYMPHWWVVLPAMVVIGTRYYGLFIIGHDGFHQRLWRNPRVNDLFNDVFLIGPIGAVTHLNKRNHLAHHRLLATHADPDRHKYSCVNKADGLGVSLYLSGIGSIVTSVTNVFVNRAEPEPLHNRDRYTLRDVVILGAWQVGLVVGLSRVFGWWGYILLWLVPLYLFTFLADHLRAFIEHSHISGDEAADEHRLITHISNPLERLFLSPMNMNFHAAHHLWPSIPYYNLAVADLEMRAAAGREGLAWRGSYLRYLWQYWRALPLSECRQQHVRS